MGNWLKQTGPSLMARARPRVAANRRQRARRTSFAATGDPVLGELIEIYPNAHILRARWNVMSRRYDAAIVELDEALRLAPDAALERERNSVAAMVVP